MFRIIFFGTSDFAIPSLQSLAQDQRFEIIGAVTQPDRPVGRHAVITPPPVKKELQQTANNIALWQPEKIKDESFSSWIKEVGSTCDAFVVVSYGKILPQWLLDLPKQGVVNVHGSLLPRWRGASPIQAAIAAGDAISGVTIMKIDAEMDHGPILAIAEEPIQPSDIGQTLHDRLAELGGKLLPDILADYLNGKITPQEQDHSQASYCKILTRDDGKLDFSKTAEEFERLIRAYNPWPGTWMEWNGKRVKILEAKVGTEKTEKDAGTLFKSGKILRLSCANGSLLEVLTIQLEGKKAVSGEVMSQQMN
jgi:methionyl-tRNA formyltransferase